MNKDHLTAAVLVVVEFNFYLHRKLVTMYWKRLLKRKHYDSVWKKVEMRTTRRRKKKWRRQEKTFSMITAYWMLV
jgi:hypothetical protein